MKTSNGGLYAVAFLGSMYSTGALADAAPPTDPGWVMPFTIIFVLGFLLIAFAGVRRSLTEGQWKLSEALSEDIELPPQKAGDPPTKLMVGSSSRLIAFMGMLVIMALVMGAGIWLLWMLFTTRAVPTGLDNLLNYFVGTATLFVPYLANQLRAAIGK